jgi:hypothetical protein
MRKRCQPAASLRKWLLPPTDNITNWHSRGSDPFLTGMEVGNFHPHNLKMIE